MFKGIREQWRALEDCVVRPPRAEYTERELVGGRSGKFAVGLASGKREDYDITNKRGQTLKCSYYKPSMRGTPTELPCVVYCHCNSGSRVDANKVVGMLVPQGIAVFALDFAGSGNSDGEHVTLGVDEVDDVEVVVAWLREKKKASHIGMWGRSMGAVVCLLYGKRDPTIAGIVLDSPFASLVSLMEELAASHKLLTGFLTKPLISILRRSIRKRANFDILKANPLKAVSSSFIPALFGHGKEDDFVAFKHSERLYEAYAGDKNLISFDGGHNSPRPDFFHTSVLIFFMNVLGPLSAGSPSPVRRTGSPNTIPDEVLLQEALALSLT